MQDSPLIDPTVLEAFVTVVLTVLGWILGRRTKERQIARHPGNNYDPDVTPLD